MDFYGFLWIFMDLITCALEKVIKLISKVLEVRKLRSNHRVDFCVNNAVDTTVIEQLVILVEAVEPFAVCV